MFRLLKLVIILSFGAYLGFQGRGILMKAECSSGGGQWTGSVCLTSGASQ